MNKFIQRLGGLDFRVLPPSGATSRDPGTCGIDDIRRFRTQVFDEFASLPTSSDSGVDEADTRSWHVVAMREGRMLGCIRLAVVNPWEFHDMPRRVLANSRCQFSPPDHARCVAALCGYASEWMKAGGPLVQAGGLAVARSARRSIVAPALCLAVNALTRLLRGKSGIVFAAEKTGAVSLYARAGCIPLRLGETDVGLLNDSFHCDHILPMHWEPHRVDPDLKEVVDALCGLLKAAVTQPEVAHV